MSSKEDTIICANCYRNASKRTKYCSDNLGTGFNSRFHEAEGTEEIHRILTTEIVFLEQLIEQFNRYPDTLEIPTYSLGQYKTFQHDQQFVTKKV